jgi:hypothetical protein
MDKVQKHNSFNTLDKRLGGPQSRFRRGNEDKEIPDSAGNWAPVVQPIIQSL